MEKCSKETRKRYYYVIEHCEDFLFNWCCYEYQQIINYLLPTNSMLIISNANKFIKFTSSDPVEMSDNTENQKALVKYAHDNNFSSQLLILPDDIHTRATEEFINIPEINLRLELNKVCLLDLKGTSELKVSDNKLYEMFIVGGILGCHPPKDRTGPLRREWLAGRHLGEMQFSTDNALLACKMVIENEIELEKIPIVDYPEIGHELDNKTGIERCVQLDFRYITAQYDYKSEKMLPPSQENDLTTYEPILHKEIKKILIECEFDIDKLMNQ